MKKTILILGMALSLHAGALQTQADALGSARAIALYWGEHIKSVNDAQKKCTEYAASQYSSNPEYDICLNSCIDNFKKITDKNGK